MTGTISLRITCSARTAARYRKQAGDEDHGKYLERLLALDKGSEKNAAA